MVKGNPQRMKAIRLELELTQEEFAKHLGASTNTVARWERGVLEPPLVSELACNYLLIKLKKGGKK